MRTIRLKTRSASAPLRFAIRLLGLLLSIAALLPATSVEANCQRINPPWNDKPLTVDFGAEIVLDENVAVGTPIATAVIPGSQLYAIKGGWVATCNNQDDAIKYWWLEQHYSQSSGSHPVPGISVDSADGRVYIMQDSGSRNPYGGGGSGSVGYTTELLVNGSAHAFSWVSASPNKNLPPIGEEIHGIPCSDALLGTGAAEGFPPLVNVNCPIGNYAVNWRQLPPFQIKVTLYRMGGSPGTSGVRLQNNNNAGFSLFSLMNRRSTPPSNNGELFNLVRLQLAQSTRVRINPCHGINNVSVSLGEVGSHRFTTLGQPASGVADTPVHITAWCHSDGDIKWAVLGKAAAYDPGGNQGILALDTEEDSASGVGIQLIHTGSRAPLPITPEGSAFDAYRWIDTNLHAQGNKILMLDFLARYVKTGDVTPGSANGHATLVLSPK